MTQRPVNEMHVKALYNSMVTGGLRRMDKKNWIAATITDKAFSAAVVVTGTHKISGEDSIVLQQSTPEELDDITQKQGQSTGMHRDGLTSLEREQSTSMGVNEHAAPTSIILSDSRQC